MALNPGQVLLGRYRIVAQLGQGGMGAVYRAWDTRLNIAVALKEMLAQPGLDPQVLAELRRQFQQEATILARLSHPNLVSVIDFFEEGDKAYLVMRYVEGESLAARIARQGALPEAQVMTWAEQLLDALAYCHGEGVLHRDIKPQNIIIRDNGQAVLVDFGLVKLWNAADPHTRTVMRGMGTPEYAPPEQYGTRGQHTDPRSDLYSLGATLYHALTGQVPMSASDRMALPDQFQPPSRLVSAVPPALETAILRAMALPLDQRYGSAVEMRAELARARPGASHATPGHRLKLPVWAIGAGAVLLLLACGGAAWGASRLGAFASIMGPRSGSATPSPTADPPTTANPPTTAGVAINGATATAAVTPSPGPQRTATATPVAPTQVPATTAVAPTAPPTTAPAATSPPTPTAVPTASPTTAPSPTLTATPSLSYEPLPLAAVANATQGFVSPPTGALTLGGVPFSLSERIFQSQAAPSPHDTNPTYARLDAGLTGVRRVHMLLTTGDGFPDYQGQRIGRVVAYCDGAAHVLASLTLGQNIREWHKEPNVVSVAPAVREVWQGEIAGTDGVMGHLDMLSLDVPDACTQGVLEAIEVDDLSADTVGSLDPAVNWNGVTVELYR